MTTPIAAAAVPQVGAIPDAATQAAQNLFEHMAAQTKALPENAGPSQLGEAALQSLKGFFERSGTFAERANTLQQRPPALGGGGGPIGVGPNSLVAIDPSRANGTTPPVGSDQIGKVVQSLGMMFNYSIETQLVVRSATQISGAANTLLRGQ